MSTRGALGVWDAVSIIIGIVIGAGIYETAPRVLANTSGPVEALLVWSAGGALSLIGACCYGELASAYPRSGGDYVYLTRAFGAPVGFLFGWAQLAVILTGSIGMMAYVFADYAAALFRIDGLVATLLACGAVVLLTLLNVVGTSAGTRAQNALAWLKLAGIAGIVVAGVVAAGSDRGDLPTRESGGGGAGGALGLAMIFTLYTYGGWNDAAFVAAEVKNPRRNMPRALLLGTLLITVVYLLVNIAILAGLGFQRASTSTAVAAELVSAVLGPSAGVAMSILVMISALGAVNGLIFTGSRIYSSVGADYPSLSWIGRWHPKWGTPATSLLVQLAIALGLIGVVGTATGRGVIDVGLGALGLAPAQWSGHGGFDTLLQCTAPIFWGFFLLTSVSLFVLRYREPRRPRPFRVPLYPLVPLIFTVTCLFMLVSAIQYAGTLTLVGLVPLLLGVPVYLASKRKTATDSAQGKALSDHVEAIGERLP